MKIEPFTEGIISREYIHIKVNNEVIRLRVSVQSCAYEFDFFKEIRDLRQRFSNLKRMVTYDVYDIVNRWASEGNNSKVMEGKFIVKVFFYDESGEMCYYAGYYDHMWFYHLRMKKAEEERRLKYLELKKDMENAKKRL